MTPGRWEEVQRVFQAALQRPPGERAAFLREACTDDALRDEVERLLAEDAEATRDRFLDPSLTPLRPASPHAGSVACPRCGRPVDLTPDDGSPRDLTCPACGSTFRVEGGRDDGAADPGGTGRQFGRFLLQEVVGSGSFGTVYKAWDTQLDRVVALKALKTGALATDEERARFVREARNAAQLKHPAIVPVHEVGEHDGLPFLVADFIDGQTLSDWLSSRTPTFRGAAELTAVVADALQFAHEHGVVHRDVKPGNIMIDAAGRPHLMDFGLARRDAADVTMTVEGNLMGTPAYMSPEQARGEARRVDGRSDVYSLGVVLYRILAGEPPFRGQLQRLVHQVLHDEPRPPRELNDRVPRDLETICLKAMAKEPSRRYATAGAMAADLRRWLAGEPIEARPVGPLSRGWLWCRRRPALAGLAATAAGLIVVTLVGLAYSLRQQELLAAEGHRRLEDQEKANREQARLLDEVDRRLDQMIGSYRPTLDRIVRDPRLVEPGAREDTLRLVEGPRRLFATLADELADRPDVGPERRADLAACLESLAAIDLALGRDESALAELERVIALGRATLQEAPATSSHARLRTLLASTLNRSGNALLRRKDGERAEARYREAIAEAEQALVSADDTTAALDTLGAACNNLAGRLMATDRAEEADRTYVRALDEYERQVARHPSEPAYLARLATVLKNWGIARRKARDPDGALARFRLAIERLEGPAGDTRDPAVLTELAAAFVEVGLTLKARGDIADALKADSNAVTILGPLVRDARDVPARRDLLAKAYNSLGNDLRQIPGQQAGAFEAFRDGVVHFARLVLDYPDRAEYSADFDAMLNSAMAALRELRASAPDRAELAHVRLLGMFECLTAAAPEVDRFRVALARSLYMVGCLRALQYGDASDDESQAAQAVDFLRRARAASDLVARAELLRKDADLKPIRGRADFEALVASIGGPEDPARKDLAPSVAPTSMSLPPAHLGETATRPSSRAAPP